MAIFNYPYQLLSQLPFCDVAIVYLLDCTELSQRSASDARLTIRQVAAQELLDTTQGSFDFDADDARQLANSAHCLAGFIDDRLAGYLWYSEGRIPSEQNTPGEPFKGFDLQLGDSSQYLFKVFVDENYRGQRINEVLCRELAQRLAAQGCDHLITLTAWENAAFRKSVERMGFKNIGNCIELATQGKSIYFFAKHNTSIVQYVAPGAIVGADS